MKMSLRGWFIVGAFASLIAALVLFGAPLRSKAAAPPHAQGALTDQSLRALLHELGLEPKEEQQRHDFRFKAVYQEQEWELSMSAVLSRDGASVWVMAWLDELPSSAADVPRTALLRLMAENDRLGRGKFFAYVSNNRRFVLQRVVPNENLTTTTFREVLRDLGVSVIETYPRWSVANWTGSNDGVQTADKAPQRSPVTAPAKHHSGPRTAPTPTATNDSKFKLPIRRN